MRSPGDYASSVKWTLWWQQSILYSIFWATLMSPLRTNHVSVDIIFWLDEFFQLLHRKFIYMQLNFFKVNVLQENHFQLIYQKWKLTIFSLINILHCLDLIPILLREDSNTDFQHRWWRAIAKRHPKGHFRFWWALFQTAITRWRRGRLLFWCGCSFQRR